MTWATYHNNQTVYGKRIHDVSGLGGTQGLPAQNVLNALLQAAEDLEIEHSYTGMTFRYARAIVQNEMLELANSTPLKDTQTKSAAICHEDRAFNPIPRPGNGVLLVHQSLAPCTRCRAAYRGWARDREAAIIVYADKGYDKSPDKTTFIFAPTGAVWRWQSE